MANGVHNTFVNAIKINYKHETTGH